MGVERTFDRAGPLVRGGRRAQRESTHATLPTQTASEVANPALAQRMGIAGLGNLATWELLSGTDLASKPLAISSTGILTGSEGAAEELTRPADERRAPAPRGVGDPQPSESAPEPADPPLLEIATAPTPVEPAPDLAVQVRATETGESPSPSVGKPDAANDATQWAQAVRGAAESIADPAPSGTSARLEAVRRAGFRAAGALGGTRAARPRTGLSIPAARSRRERDPVPEATKAYRAAFDAELPPQSLPERVASAYGTQAPLGASAVDAFSFHVVSTPTTQELAERTTNEVLRKMLLGARARLLHPEAETEEMRALARGGPAPEPATSTSSRGAHARQVEPEGQAPTLPSVGGERVPPRAPLAPLHKERVRDLLARELARPHEAAMGALVTARAYAFQSSDILSDASPHLGDDQLAPGLESELLAKFQGLARAIGIAEDELDAAVQSRRALLEERDAAARGALQLQSDDASSQVCMAGQSALNATERGRAQGRKDAEALRRVAPPTRAERIRTRCDSLLQSMQIEVARETTRLRRLLEARKRELGRQASLYREAYTFAAQSDRYRLQTEAMAPLPPGTQRGVAIADVLDWQAARHADVDLEFASREGEAQQRHDALVTALLSVADARRKALREWAAREIGEDRSEAQAHEDALEDAAKQLRANAEDWAAVQNEGIGARAAVDLEALQVVVAAQAAGQDCAALLADQRLRSDQREIAKAFFRGGEDEALGVVAGRLRESLLGPRIAELAAEIEKLFLPAHNNDEEALQKVGEVQRPGFNAEKIASRVEDAVDRVGTKESWIWEALKDLTPVQSRAIQLVYIRKFDTTIESDLRGDLSGREKERALALLAADQVGADAIAVRQAMHGNWEGNLLALGLSGIGVDRDALFEVTRGRSPEHMQSVAERYGEMFAEDGQHADMLAEVDDELRTALDRDRFKAAYRGDRDLEYALELGVLLPTPAQVREQGAWMRVDRGGVEEVYARIRAEVLQEAARKQWNSATVEARITQRCQRVREHFEQRFAGVYGHDQGSALTAALEFGIPYSQGRRNLVEALSRNDQEGADAARVRIEDEGTYASDNVLNSVLANQERRAWEAVRLDEDPIRRVLIAEQLEKEDAEFLYTDEKYLERRRALQREHEREMERVVARRSRANLEGLRAAYGRDYDQDFDRVVLGGMSGWDAAEARERLATGYLTPAQRIYYGRGGVGTNEALMREALAGRTREEIAAMSVEYRRMYGRDMEDDILDDVSGRDELDFRHLLRGEPTTLAEEISNLEAQYRDEVGVGFLGGRVAGDQAREMRGRLDALRAQRSRLQSRSATPAQRQAEIGLYESQREAFQVAVEDHRRKLDNFIDRVSTAIAIALTVIVVAVLSFVTMGLAAAALLALAASVAGTVMTMGLKYAVLGGTYGSEEILTDLAVGVVDAAVSAATAGMGGRLLGTSARAGAQGLRAAAARVPKYRIQAWAMRRLVGEGAEAAARREAGFLARRIPENALLKSLHDAGGFKKVTAIVIAEGAENVASSVPTGFVSTALSGETWESGDVLENLTVGTLQQAGVAFAAGTAFQGASGSSRWLWNGGKTLWRRMADAPGIGNMSWKEFRLSFPESSHLEYLQTRESALFANAHPARDFGDAGDFASRAASESAPHDGVVLVRELAAQGGAQKPWAGSLASDELQSALPPRLRDRVPIRVDPELPGRTVRVHYFESDGIIVDVFLVAGRDAGPVDVAHHVPTVQAMRRYTGIAGRVRRQLGRMHDWLLVHPNPPVGSTAWEARLELEKLPLVLEDRLELLRNGGLSAKSRASVLADVEHLARQVDHHQAALDRMERSPGQGYVAAEGVPSDGPPRGVRRHVDVLAGAYDDHVLYSVGDSTLSAKSEVFQIGPSWIEESATKGRRRYRAVEVRDSQGRVVDVREEIEMPPPQRWRERGSWASRKGRIGEAAWKFEEHATAMNSPGTRATHLSEGTFPGYDVTVYDHGNGRQTVLLHGKPPNGFDGVVLSIHPDGVSVKVVEVKHYPNDYVPFADITAVGNNLDAAGKEIPDGNPEGRIRKNLNDLLKGLEKHGTKLGLDARVTDGKGSIDALEALVDAVAGKKFSVELVITPATRIGNESGELAGSQYVVNKLRASLTDVGNPPVRVRRLSDSHFQLASETMGPRLRSGEHTFDRLSPDSTGAITPESSRYAELATLAQRKEAGVLPPISRTDVPGRFLDFEGRTLFVMPAPRRPGPAGVDKLADDLVGALHATANLSGKSAGSRPLFLLDVSQWQVADLRRLERALLERTRGNTPARLELSRIVGVHRRTASARPLVRP